MYFTDLENKESIIHSVSEINQMLVDLLSDCFTSLQVTGEVSNFSCPRSGHWYFSLKDEKTQIRCVFFYGEQRAAHLNLVDGIQIIVQTKIRLYKVRGELQLEIEKINAVGDGVLYQKFEMLKAELAAQGLFDAIHKKPLPSSIHTIGVITSPTGAALQDIISVLERRFPLINIIIYPSLVQGEKAAQQVVDQIQMANHRQECQALIVARGGGSLEDLWPFNEAIVAQAISKSILPIISAVGHEIDITIADLVADIRAATPSAAAELISPDRAMWMQQLQQIQSQLHQYMTQYLESSKQKLIYSTRYLKHPGQHFQNILQQLDGFEARLNEIMQYQLEHHHQRLVHCHQALHAVHPLAILSRGYAVLKKEYGQQIIHQITQVQKGEMITIQLAHGQLKCIVQDILTEDKQNKG